MVASVPYNSLVSFKKLHIYDLCTIDDDHWPRWPLEPRWDSQSEHNLLSGRTDWPSHFPPTCQGMGGFFIHDLCCGVLFPMITFMIIWIWGWWWFWWWEWCKREARLRRRVIRLASLSNILALRRSVAVTMMTAMNHMKLNWAMKMCKSKRSQKWKLFPEWALASLGDFPLTNISR